MTEIDLTPITRLEYDIDAILNDHAVAEPITRIELILADIVAGNTTTVVPVTRIETYLAIISGADYPVPEPVTRIETFLAIIAGEDYEEPEAVTRLEGLLAEWVEKGSGIWKTVTGTLIHITDALALPVRELSVAIEPQQSGSGDPSPTNVRPITGWTGCNIYRSGADTSSPTTYPISWQTEAGEVYGGTLDVVNGTLTVNTRTSDLTQAGWTYQSGGYFRSVVYTNVSRNDPAWCSMYKYNIGTSSEDKVIYFTSANRLVIRDSSYGSSVSDFVAGIQGIQFVCTIPEPITYTLTPQQITTLVGENNIWADVNGKITLTYKSNGNDSDIVGTGKADFMKLLS